MTRNPPSKSPLQAAILVLVLCLCLASAPWTPALGEGQPAAADPVIDPGADPILIGLDADMSKGAAQSGAAIRRGLVLAVEDINARGGLLGRPLSLVVRDHRGTPARGRDNIEELAAMEDLVAVVGGIHTPVVLAELDAIHRHGLPYLAPWAAGTSLVSNGYDPNFVFRVSVRDEHAGGFLVQAARDRGFGRLGLLLWRTGWGRSNETAMRAALARQGLEPVAVAWFNTGERDMSAQIDALRAAGAEVIMLVSNPTDGLVAVREVAGRPEAERLPIISHWGITGGDFFAQAGEALAKVDLSFLQTFSFFDPPFPERAARLYEAYCARFGGCSSPADVFSPAGTAQAYDLVQLLGQAIRRAGSTDRAAVRDSLERLERYEGLLRDYDPAFTPSRHDALDASDFRLSRYDAEGAIIPIGTP